MLATRLFARIHARIPLMKCLPLALLMILPWPEVTPAGAPLTSPVAYVDLISPVSIAPGSTGVTLTISGVGFLASSVVQWNGTALTTTFVSSKKLTASVPDALVAAAGLGSVTVVNPRPGGGPSNLVYVPVEEHLTSTVFPSTASSTISTGTTPQGLVTGDFNGDGKIDLAIANKGSGNVTILLGNGDGTFTTAPTVAAGAGANWIAVGDFNEDGKPDLAVANFSSTGPAGVTILLGNGDGTFTAGASPATGSGPFSIVTADFNGDGHLDLAVSNSVDGTVTLLLGVGNGTFTLGSTSTVGTQPQVLAPGDFNEDGILDLAVTNQTSNTVSILIGKADGTFQGQTTVAVGGTGSPIGLIEADYNADGHVDLAAVNASDVAILLGNGAGVFTLMANPTTGTSDLIAGVVGDYNGDGKEDLVVSDRTAGEAFLLPGNGDGTFGAATTYTTAAGAFGVATADFNGDGALDLAISNGGANNLSIFLQVLPIQLSPTSLSFGYQLINTTSAARVVTLTNHTGSTLNFTSISFTGADSAEFAETNTCLPSVASSGTCTISVTFTPTLQGPRAATMQIVDDYTNPTQTLAVSGIGATAPAITSANSATFILGAPNSFTVTTTGLPVPAVSETGALPTGVTFNDNGDGTATLAGTPAAGTAGTYPLAITAHNGFGVDATQSFTLNVVAPQTIAKSFGVGAIPLNGTTTLSFTLTNPAGNTIALAGVNFTDSLPGGLLVATPNGLVGTCAGGTITATAGSGSVSLAGATLGVGATCNFSVNVTGTTAGVMNNSVTGNSTTAGAGNTATAAVTVIAPAVLSKAFGAASIPLNGATSLSFTVQNNNTTSSLTSVGFTDTLPAGLVISTPNGLTGTCGGGTITATQASNVVSLTGAAIAQSASCTFSVNVTGTAAGQKNNVTGSVTSTEGGTGNTASASIAVVVATDDCEGLQSGGNRDWRSYGAEFHDYESSGEQRGADGSGVHGHAAVGTYGAERHQRGVRRNADDYGAGGHFPDRRDGGARLAVHVCGDRYGRLRRCLHQHDGRGEFHEWRNWQHGYRESERGRAANGGEGIRSGDGAAECFHFARVYSDECERGDRAGRDRVYGHSPGRPGGFHPEWSYGNLRERRDYGDGRIRCDHAGRRNAYWRCDVQFQRQRDGNHGWSESEYHRGDFLQRKRGGHDQQYGNNCRAKRGVNYEGVWRGEHSAGRHDVADIDDHESERDGGAGGRGGYGQFAGGAHGGHAERRQHHVWRRGGHRRGGDTKRFVGRGRDSREWVVHRGGERDGNRRRRAGEHHAGGEFHQRRHRQHGNGEHHCAGSRPDDHEESRGKFHTIADRCDVHAYRE